jgi:seryl-tRNA synthetase
MLDFNDFVVDRGGDPAKIKESQRRRFAPESAVDEVLELYAEARRGKLKKNSFARTFFSLLNGV